MPFSLRPFRRALLYFLFELSLIFPIGMGLLVPIVQARGEACPVAPNPEWTSIEKRVWETICVGKVANLTQTNLGKTAHSSPVIRAKFLEEIVREKRYQVPLEARGVRLIGAEISGALDLSHTTFSSPLGLRECRFNGPVNLQGLHTDHFVSFKGSTFDSALDLSLIRVGESLDLTQGSFQTVTLQGAHIDTQLLLDDSTFEGKVTMSSVRTGASVMMRSSEFKGMVDLHASYIGKDVNTQNSSFLGALNLDGTQVAGNVYLRSVDPDRPEKRTIPTRVMKLDFYGARIEKSVYITDAIIKEELMLERLHVGDRLEISRTTINAKNVALAFSDIGSLFVFASLVPSLDMTGTVIHTKLALGTNKWAEDARLTLRNTETKSLSDREDAWPNKLVLNGFVYLHTDPLGSDTAGLADRTTEWLKVWLSKQVLYSPQPYKQLASILHSVGYKEKAEEILFESKERERASSASLNWWLLTFQKYFIGYGYRSISYPLKWASGFAVVGCLFLFFWQNPFKDPRYSPPPSLLPLFLEKQLSRRWSSHINQGSTLLAYSLDRFLPVVKLREHLPSSIKPSGWLSYWFLFQQLMGYVVTAFFIAGLSGLVER